MAETVNIMKMAEVVSDELFRQLRWNKVGPTNQSWNCINPSHSNEKHSTDVVLYYDEPYRKKRTYVHCDLKSYAKNTIKPDKIRKTLTDLTNTVQCAQVSEEWQNTYLQTHIQSEIVGLLFIYNNDGEYDKAFGDLLATATDKPIKIPEGNRVFVLGPKEICYLVTIVTDMALVLAKARVADESYGFFYPDLMHRKVLQSGLNLPATLELISGPWQILKYSSDHSPGTSYDVIVYYKGHGKESDEFIYIIDYLFHYQVVQNANKISLKLPNASPEAHTVYQKAISEYSHFYEQSSSFAERLKKISYDPIVNICRQYNPVDVGMER